MSHVLKSGLSVFTTDNSIIKVKDTITLVKQPISIGLNNAIAIEFNLSSQRYYIASFSSIKVYDSDFTLIDTINSISGIVSMQLDILNNRLIVTERNTPSFQSINLSTHAITTIFSITGVTEIVRFGYFDSTSNRFYVGTNQVYTFSTTGSLIGIISDSRLQNSNVTNIIKNPYTGLLMISINNKILVADPASLLVQSISINGTGVETPTFIRFDPINSNSYWLCNTAYSYITEMSVATNTAKRIIALGNSTPFGIWVENTLGIYSLIIADAAWNQFYRLKERLV
ncbi:hypothetical protein [Mucilaginibacter celer]|uniref:Uncharacterized protein n=1 Tax=Mucilaginibacter celer TaxID=2305508 RepID=A0A494VNZ1_9SPHI|nr:hypothetical protein [Mucilaginibacter celer]AYL96424.1 hypothetical protein HYN43_014445 [Mucilaginibacter celer]